MASLKKTEPAKRAGTSKVYVCWGRLRVEAEGIAANLIVLAFAILVLIGWFSMR